MPSFSLHRRPAARAELVGPGVLDQDLDLASLTIEGELVCAARDLAIRTGHIMVHNNGRLVCRSAAKPYTNR